MAKRFRPLFWLPPNAAQWVYSTLLRPRPIRALTHAVVRLFIPRQIQVEGVTLALNPSDPVMSGSIAMGCHEHRDLEIFRSLLKPGMCVADIGANIGLYAAVAAKAVGPTGLVVAIEPVPHNFELVERTVALNGFTQVRPIQAAVSDRPGELALYINADNTGDNRAFNAEGTRPAVRVPAVTVDSLWEERGFPPIDVIKMDIQGAEGLAVEGMRRIFAQRPKLTMLMEFWPWGLRQCGRDPAELLRTLRAAGFSIHWTEGTAADPFPPASDEALLALNLERQYVSVLLKRGGA